MYKCHLLLNGKHGNKTEDEKHTARFDAMYQRAAIDRFLGTNPDGMTAYIDRLTPRALHDDAQFVIIKRVEVNGLRSDSIVLAHPEYRRGSLQPVFFHRSDEITVRAKLLLAFRAADAAGLPLVCLQDKLNGYELR